jgi:C_GCAxxG_C_C family probable redox protein
MTNADLAVSKFNKGANCCQAILGVYGPPLGVDLDLAMRLGGPFEGGMGCSGATCGAVTGALMVLGLHISNDAARVREASEEFVRRFEEKNGALHCRQLLGRSIRTPSELEEAAKERLFAKVCPKLVRSAAHILEDLMRDGNR